MTRQRTRRSVRRSTSITLPALLACCVTLHAGPAHAQRWAPGERTLLTEFDRVTAVAADMRHVYAATPNGLVIYDQLAREWRRPSTALDGFPIGNVPTALAWDDFSGMVWMGTQGGVVWRYSPDFGRWEQGVIAPGAVRAIGFGGGDAFLLAGGQWLVARGGMFSAEPVAASAVPADVRAQASGREYSADPFLRTVLGALPPDPSGNRWRALAITPGERRGTYWIGTDGGGLLAYDARTNQADWLQYGLPSRGTTLIARAAGLLWFGGDARAPRPGIAVADTLLSSWRRFDAERGGAPAGALYDVLEAHERVWLASEDGVHALRMRDLDRSPARADWLHAGSLDGLPAPDAFALARAIDGVWVGTARGLVHVDTAGAVSQPVLPGVAVYDLSIHDGRLWAATARGLVRIEGSEPTRPADAPPALEGTVRGVVSSPDGLWTLTADAVFLHAADGTWHLQREPGLAGIGALRRIAADAAGVWIAADGGAAFREAASGVWRYYSVPADIPEAPVVSVLPVGSHAWLGTPAGALRLPMRP